MKRANRFDNRGFSLAEVMLTVAILVVLFALAMIPISKYQKEFRQQELDSKAELVFSSQDLTRPEEKNDSQNPPTQALPVVVKTPPRVVVAENLD